MNHLRIDLDNDYSRIAVWDDEGKLFKRPASRSGNLERITEEYPGSKAASEATSNYYTIHNTLNAFREELEMLGIADVYVTEAYSRRADVHLLAHGLKAGTDDVSVRRKCQTVVDWFLKRAETELLTRAPALRAKTWA
jgi:hypothetical protein